MDRCPFCQAQVTSRCRCLRADSQCANGHRWHFCEEHGRLVGGESDHSKAGRSCVKGKTYEVRPQLVPVE